MIYWAHDVETTGFSPVSSSIISSGSVLADTNFNILDKRYHKATVGPARFIPNVFGRETSVWSEEAERVHGITWEQQLEFPEPIEMYRDLYRMLNQYPDEQITYIYHANGDFDPKHLMYHSNIHAPKFYQYLNKRLCFYQMEEDGEHITPYRMLNTMSLARQYIREGNDSFKQIAKYQKIIDKMNGYLTKKRKTPAKPEKIAEWTAKKEQAEVDIACLDYQPVRLDGYSLDKICKALELKLDHHNALSDAEVLIPITKFLLKNLST